MKSKHYLLPFFLCLTTSHCFCSNAAPDSVSKAGPSHKFGTALRLGTTPGFDFAYRISPKITILLGYTYFKYTVNTVAKTADEGVKLDAGIKMSAVSGLVEYHPFRKSSFKLLTGVSYINQGLISVLVTPEGNYTFGTTVFTPEEVGNVSLSVDYGQSAAPFVGIGFGRTVPKRRVGIGFEMGMYYIKSPVISMSGKERLSSMSEQQAQVQENMKDWRYWPVMNLRLAIRLD
ncbi:hypothetical protein [Runella slithyformis]|uniref:Outer membrane protein beta-barrel domain-containing protein n=1 Tax=Runella slithyformis (strain ATCC 29530 / DSM 19594 / LMG 11500 / NCIMB 11436 / LSU 4) TaxID=761193 RepID=A0A7U3ZGL7_RUNSL|nr:hypothetical protein [Runella slithyformis]AEI46845.1 hypothetical protein Runsl_0393 [Runella slithyformis DSM 19594]